MAIRALASTTAVPGCFVPSATLMELAEVDMSTVHRWSRYRDALPSTSPQSSGAHCYALALMVPYLLAHLSPEVKLDQALLLRAVLAHDLGEGLLGRDILYDYKSSAKDADEYRAWCDMLKVFSPAVSDGYKRDFLLQFCLTHSNDSAFENEAHQIMDELQQNHRLEAVAFRVLEFMEYLVYAIRQYQDRDNRQILIDVIGNQLENLEFWGAQLPGFMENFWTPELSAWCRTERAKLNGAVA